MNKERNKKVKHIDVGGMSYDEKQKFLEKEFSDEPAVKAVTTPLIDSIATAAIAFIVIGIVALMILLYVVPTHEIKIIEKADYDYSVRDGGNIDFVKVVDNVVTTDHPPYICDWQFVLHKSKIGYRCEAPVTFLGTRSGDCKCDVYVSSIDKVFPELR